MHSTKIEKYDGSYVGRKKHKTHSSNIWKEGSKTNLSYHAVILNG